MQQVLTIVISIVIEHVHFATSDMIVSANFKSIFYISGISQWIDGDCVATIGRVKQTARAVEILGSWKVCGRTLLS